PLSTNSEKSVMDFSDIPGLVTYGHGDLPSNLFRKRSKPRSSPPIQEFVLQKPPLTSPVWIPPEPPLKFYDNYFEKVAPTPEPPEAKVADKPVEDDWAVVDVEEPPPEFEKDGEWTEEASTERMVAKADKITIIVDDHHHKETQTISIVTNDKLALMKDHPIDKSLGRQNLWGLILLEGGGWDVETSQKPTGGAGGNRNASALKDSHSGGVNDIFSMAASREIVGG
ncbi:hypothetical protein FOZ63_030816, partial [Perkinsus olseni]